LKTTAREVAMALTLYVLDRGERLEVLGDPVANALICNRPLRHWQQQLAVANALEFRVVSSETEVTLPALVMDGDVMATPLYFEEFLGRAVQGGRNLVAGLQRHVDLDLMVKAQKHQEVKGGYTFGLRYLVDDAAPVPLLLKMDDAARARLKVPRAMNPDGVAVTPQSARAILHIQAPLHLLTANMHQNLALMDARLPRFAFQRRAQAGKEANHTQVGPWSDIHPSAVVHNCTVGRGVFIGAHAVCRNSIIGDGAQVLDGAQVSGSVVGTNAMVSHLYRVIRSVMYPESAVVSGALQFSLLGEAAAVYAAWITDVRMDAGTIRTVVGGHVVDSGLRYLGVTLGHGARLTAGTISAPGRIIPNGMHVYPDPERVFRGVPPGHDPRVPLEL
jgi:acetyltransferase-like isoleucine patch superfamily enzyme